MNNSMKGSMEMLSAMQITSDMKGQDIQSKTILCHPEALAVILRDTVAEYRNYSWQEIRAEPIQRSEKTAQNTTI